jgi:hypothetical protein
MIRLIPVKTVIGTDAERLLNNRTMYTEDGRQSSMLKAGVHSGHLNELYYKLDSKNENEARLISMYGKETRSYGKDVMDDSDVKPYVYERQRRNNNRR